MKKHAILLTIAIVVLVVISLGFAGAYFFNGEPKEQTVPTVSDSGDQGSKTVSGIVTAIKIDCGGRSETFENGERKVSTTRICDAPSYFAVDGQTIYVSNGYAPNHWSKDIKHVHAGDQVEVEYIVEKSNGSERASLNCETCSVKVQEAFQGPTRVE